MRVVGADGSQLGILPIATALETARQQELDLVEVAPDAAPPVCRIMDFGKYKYTQARRLKEARKKQTTIQVKEVKMGPKTEKHDFDFKLKHVRRFLEEGHKAKVTVRFKGREMAHTELGRKILDRLVGDLGDLAIVEAMPKQEGRNMIMVIGPNKRYLEDLAKQEARAAREAAKEAAAPEPTAEDADALEPTAEDAAALEPTAETVAPAADEG